MDMIARIEMLMINKKTFKNYQKFLLASVDPQISQPPYISKISPKLHLLFKSIKIYLQTNFNWIADRKMKNSFNDQDDSFLSPAQFLLQSPEAIPLPPLLNDYNSSHLQSEQPLQKSLEDAAATSSRELKKKLAGVKSREKKKRYLQTLEQDVKVLTSEVEQYELEISRCKDQLVEAIQTSSQHSNEHVYTFSQLQKNIQDQDPDIDRINLLLDIIQTRIGANARERQANLDYSFKQMINSIFPAMHRYLMHSSTYSYDLFDQQVSSEGHQFLPSGRWTEQLLKTMGLSESQLGDLSQFGDKLISKRQEAMSFIMRLQKIKGQIKQQQSIFELKMSQFRGDMTPIQSGLITVFGQKNKLRRQFAIGIDLYEQVPKKKVKQE